MDKELLVNNVLRAQLMPFDQEFANGDRSNNHLDLGFNETKIGLLGPIIMAASDLIIESGLRVDFIGAVPNGAVGWSRQIAQRLPDKPKVIVLKKLGKREFVPYPLTYFATNNLVGKCGIVLDDVTTDGGTSEAYADALSKLDLNIGAVVSLLYRGFAAPRSQYKRISVLTHPIPTNINWPLFKSRGIIENS